jgi:hypothetical protein
MQESICQEKNKIWLKGRLAFRGVKKKRWEKGFLRAGLAS